MITSATSAMVFALAVTAGACTAPDSTIASSTDSGISTTASLIDRSTSATTEEFPVSMNQVLAATSPADLTSEEIDGLVFMREEEKLAYDVYVTLSDVWGLTVFDNISGAEASHIASVRVLLDRFEIDDPAETLEVGEFSNPDLQVLYDDLVARGSVSAIEALMVGALIEELDIQDLQSRASTNADIDLVYDQLERGSRNHLRAFVRQLDRRGVDYTPILLGTDAFDAIISSETETGNGRTGGGGRGAGRGRVDTSN